jgi:DNA-3-methyladenine glycosylase
MAGRIARRELLGPADEVARALLGARVVSDVGGVRVAVRLTEVEAYAGLSDPASHAFRGPTPRTQVMFGPAGHLYVYFTYGMHWCANVVCGAAGEASAVLLRAGVVVTGVEHAHQRRPSARTAGELAPGPARLAEALALDAEVGGIDLLDPRSPVRLRGPLGSVPPGEVIVGPRVGVSAGKETPWRFRVAPPAEQSLGARAAQAADPG